MIKKPVKIQLSEGLDARPIALLVQEASQYSSSVYILKLTRSKSMQRALWG